MGIEQLDPKAVWRFFAGLAAVPRESKHEERICAHVMKIAREHGLSVRQEPVGNLIIDVPATPGHESAPITVLQAHLDMVCEKNPDTTHDFDNDPIRLIVDKDPKSGEVIVRADGTTLGADNGMGVAMALAAATLGDVVHSQLELLFTIDEEAGMTGAKALTPGSFKGRRLLNLDSEEDNAIYIGCAGGCDTNYTWRCAGFTPAAGTVACRVAVAGLRGGHSGGDIHEGRGNANKLLVRTLLRAGRPDLAIASVNGGSKRNAIPREAHAVVVGAPGLVAVLSEAAQLVQVEAQGESLEPGAAITIEDVAIGDVAAAMTPDDTQRLLAALASVPSGVLGMHPSVPGLVETSNNLSTISSTTDQGGTITIEVGMLSRSSSASRIDETLAQLAAIGRLAGADVKTANAYPGWEPNVNSAILEVCKATYRELFHKEPIVAAIHAGLECGIIGKRVGEIDTASVGPRITGAHSPDERIYVASVAKSWEYLKAVLAELART